MSGRIVVIGASTAGLYAAEILARNGQQVLLFERSQSLTPQERTYIITPGLLRVIPDLDPKIIRHRIDTIQVLADDALAEIQLSSPDLILDRREIILELARRAVDAGVEIKLGCEFAGLSTGNGTARLLFNKGREPFTVGADQLIGADGVSSAVRNLLNSDPIPSVPLLQAVVRLPEDWDDRVTRVWFSRQETPYFYWLIPDRERMGVMGLITDPGTDIQALLDGFLERQGLKALSYQSGLASLYQRGAVTEFLAGALPISLVGDAAGQVKVTTVGGTVTGLAAARRTAERILSGGRHPGGLRPVRRELDLHDFIRRMLNKMSPGDYADLINLITPAVGSLLSTHDRDSMWRHFWKLPLLQPGFIPLGVRLLLR